MAAVARVAGGDEGNLNEPRGETWAKKLSRIMYSYGRELCIVLVVIFTTFTAFQNSPLKTRKAKPPERFFPWDSLVSDYYMGNIQSAFERMRESDLSFVFYYAPWDASSRKLRQEFDAVASIYHDEVLFVAINCWWPEGECKIQFPKVRSFPVLMMYPSSGRGIQYHGKLTHDLMMAFLNHVITPVTVIYSPKDLVRLRAQHGSVVVGFFNFNESPQPPGYNTFYIAAQLHLEEDPVKEVAFAIVPNAKVAQFFNVTSSKTVLYYLWNSTEVYSSEQEFKVNKLLGWVKSHRVSALRWIYPPGKKSLLISNVMSTSSTLILTTPKMNLMHVPSPYYNMLQEIVLDYHNCNRSDSTRELMDESKRQRRNSRLETKKLRDQCKSSERQSANDNPEGTEVDRDRTVKCCHTMAPPGISVSSGNISCDVCGSFPCLVPSFDDPVATFSELLNMFGEEPNCKEFLSREHWFQSLSACCFHRGWLRNHVDSNAGVSEGQNVAELKRHDLSRKCRLVGVALAHRSHAMLASSWREQEQEANKDERRKTGEGFTGLACRTNRTLMFIAMDSVEYGVFSQRLGVNVNQMKAHTSAIIFNGKRETVHALRQEVNLHSLQEFIQNYTSGSLDRFLRSSPSPSYNCDNTKSGEVCVVDVTAETFNEIVLDEKKEVVLMVYAPWCVFCAGIAHIYLAASGYFRSSPEILFARINGDTNDLPWEYTVERYPSIFLFPFRKSESVAFPSSTPITLVNIVRFVLSNVGRHVQTDLALRMCTAKCITKNRILTLARIYDLLSKFRIWQARCRKARNVLNDCPQDDNWSKYLSYCSNKLVNLKARLRLLKEVHFTLSTTSSEVLLKSEIARINSVEKANVR